MTASLRIARAEGYRLLRGRIGPAVLLILALVSAARVLLTRAAASADAAGRLAVGRGAPATLDSGTGWAPLVDGWRTGVALGGLLLLLFAARTIASDRERGILRLATTRSATRSSLVIGRALLAPILVPLVILASGAGAWAGAVFLFDFGPLVESGYELTTRAELIAELRNAVLLAVPPLLAAYAFGLLVSCCVESPARAAALVLFLFLGFDLFKEVLGQGRMLVFAAYIPSIVDQSALSEMAGVARGFSDAGFSDDLFRKNLWVPVPQAILFLALACLGLRRRAL